MGWAVGGISVFPLPSPQDVPHHPMERTRGHAQETRKNNIFGGGKGGFGCMPKRMQAPGMRERAASPPWRTTRGVLRGMPLVFMCHGEGVALLWTNARICTALPFLGTSCSPAVFHLQESSFPVGHWFHSKRPEPCLLQARVSWPPGWTREFLGGAAFNLLRNIHHPV